MARVRSMGAAALRRLVPLQAAAVAGWRHNPGLLPASAPSRRTRNNEAACRPSISHRRPLRPGGRGHATGPGRAAACAREKHHILTHSLPNGSEKLCRITLMNSHHHHRHWLHHSAHVDRSFRELDESCTAPVTVSVCYHTCRSLSITCSVSANNTLPMGRDRSSIFAQMIWSPLGTGKRFHQH